MRPILIDLNIPEFELREICSEISLCYDFVISKKEEHDMVKMYIDLDTFKMFAFTVKDSDEIIYTEAAKFVFESMKPMRMEAKSYDSDAILEKISVSGIDSLTDGERSFLESI